MKKAVISRRYLGVVFIVLAMALAPMVVRADVVTFDLGTQIGLEPPSQLPTGTPPWLTATFTDISSGLVRLTLTANTLKDLEHVGYWYFNVDHSLLTALSISNENPASIIPGAPNTIYFGDSNTTPASAIPDNQQFQYLSGVQFDFAFKFGGVSSGSPPHDFLGATPNAQTNQVTYDISATGITASSFNLSDSSGQWLTAAWIEDIAEPGKVGHWAVGVATPVPEPATMLLLGSGLIGLAGIARKKFRK